MLIQEVPFLTRFFRALAEDIRIPKTEPPVPEKRKTHPGCPGDNKEDSG